MFFLFWLLVLFLMFVFIGVSLILVCVRVIGWYSGMRFGVCFVVMMFVIFVILSIFFFFIWFFLISLRIVGFEKYIVYLVVVMCFVGVLFEIEIIWVFLEEVICVSFGFLELLFLLFWWNCWDVFVKRCSCWKLEVLLEFGIGKLLRGIGFLLVRLVFGVKLMWWCYWEWCCWNVVGGFMFVF